MEKDVIDLGTERVFVLFRKYFIPTLMGMLGMSAVTAVDGIFVGHGVGSDGIGAINICVPIIMFFTGVGLMIGAGCSVVSSIHLARGKRKVAQLNVTQAVSFVTLIALVFTTLMMCFPLQTVRLLGASDHLAPLAIDYLLWFVPALWFQMLIPVALFVIRLDGSPRYAMWCSLATAVVNTVLDWVFIFPLGWGLHGAAFASALGMAVGGVMALVYLLFKASTLKMKWPKMSLKSLRLSVRNIGYQCRIGSSALLGETTMAILAWVGNYVFLYYLGDDGVSAFGIACYYAPFVFMVGNAIAQSAQPIVSFNFGQQLYDRTHAALRISIATAVMCGLLVMMVFVFAPHLLVGLFVDPSSGAARVAIEGFPWFSLAFVCFIVNLSVIGYYQSIERMMPATIFALMRGAIYLVPSFWVTPLILGERGIWLALAFSEALTTLSIVVYRCYVRPRRAKAVRNEG